MKFITKLLDVLFPENFTCEICGREIFDGGRLCDSCRQTVEFNTGCMCPVCGRKTVSEQLCLECKESTPLYDKAVSALVYCGGATQLIYSYKNGKAYLKRYFCDLLIEKCKELDGADAICYVPMTKSAERRRGYNQSRLLAEEIAKALGLPLIKNAIEKVKTTSAQKTLNKRERAENLKSSFKAARNLVQGKNFIVVDDVLTTGATADAISGELKKRGANKVYFATVASVEYKGEI